jgi:multicomponent Na+:H+ antiporter subunit E
MRRDLPIDPHLVRYRVALPPGPGRTLLAGVVSLLPGTLTADVADGATLTVHAITADPQRAVRALEVRIAALYGTPIEGSS